MQSVNTNSKFYEGQWVRSIGYSYAEDRLKVGNLYQVRKLFPTRDGLDLRIEADDKGYKSRWSAEMFKPLEYQVGDVFKNKRSGEEWKVIDMTPTHVYYTKGNHKCDEPHASALSSIDNFKIIPGRQFVNPTKEQESTTVQALKEEIQKLRKSSNYWEDMGRKYEHLLVATQKMETDLGKLRTAIGELKFNEIIDG